MVASSQGEKKVTKKKVTKTKKSPVKGGGSARKEGGGRLWSIEGAHGTRVVFAAPAAVAEGDDHDP